MLEAVAALILLAPLTAALALGGGRLLGLAYRERFTSRLALTANLLSLLGVAALIGAWWQGSIAERIELGTWLESGSYRLDIALLIDPLSLTGASLTAFLGLLLTRFSVDYMHREPGFQRFFALLCLFNFGMLLLLVSANAAVSFVGWEIAGLCSYLLIAFFYDRATAAGNATQAFVTNRVGDAGFLLGIFLSFIWLGAIDWQAINESPESLGALRVAAIAACFMLAAIAKSGLVPLTSWLSRAMEGPTPSSALFYAAVMVHAGVFLILRLQPLLEASPVAMGVLAVIGLLTALYGFFCGLVQTDIKSALICSVSAQVGLMIFACGMGWWTLALVHLCAHALVRGYQFLTAPSVLHQLAGISMRPVPRWLAGNRFAYAAAINRWWLDEALRAGSVAPVRRLANDLDLFDTTVVDRATGLPAPAVRALSSLAQWEERRVGAPLFRNQDPHAPDQARGVLGRITHWSAELFHFLEDTVVLRGIGQGLVHAGRALGRVLLRVEHYLRQPRLLFLLAVLVMMLAA